MEPQHSGPKWDDALLDDPANLGSTMPTVGSQKERAALRPRRCGDDDAARLDSAAVLRQFRQPPAEFSTAPFWVWNDEISPGEVRATLAAFAEQGVRQLIIHPRPGLRTPYLSPAWFELWRAALAAARELDVLLWIYDENSYPSGFAGGRVPRDMPESRGQGVVARHTATLPPMSADVISVFVRSAVEGYVDVTPALRAGQPCVADEYLVIERRWAESQPWYGGTWYVDLLGDGVAERFFDITLGAYERECGEEFGGRILGVFTDEPHICPADGLPWTPELPALFAQRWGYELSPHLPSLFEDVGDYRRIRHDYYRLLLERFIERWAKPYYERCEQLGLELTGHYWEHDWPFLARGPDSMAMYAWQQRPGIDMLANQFTEQISGQFGNLRAVLELTSVANQLDRPRTLCEAYGAAGWELSFGDMKRLGDWLYALGVNTMNQHASFHSLRGARKRDHPPTFSWQQPWWAEYRRCADYFARLSVALSAGRQINRVLVLEPTLTAWMYNDGSPPDGPLAELGQAFQPLLLGLTGAQVAFDLGSETIMAAHGDVADGALLVGRGCYGTVVLPPRMENIASETLTLLRRFLDAGGDVLACGAPPTRVDGRTSSEATAVARHASWRRVSVAEAIELLVAQPDDGLRIVRSRGDGGLLVHHRRRLADGELLFLANVSDDETATGAVLSVWPGVEGWDPHTGDVIAVPHDRHADGRVIDFVLRPGESLLLHLSERTVSAAPAAACNEIEIALKQPLTITRVAPNVSVLDYVDLEVAGRRYESEYVLAAAQRVFETHGLKANPWDRAVQAGDTLITQAFAPDSGFAATYRFEIRDAVPAVLHAVIERADLYEVSCNGEHVRPDNGCWLDESFLRCDIARAARVGANELRIVARPMSMLHELEAAYLVGDFAADAAIAGFAIAPPRPLHLGTWRTQGLPFYAGDVRYARECELDSRASSYIVELPAWRGAVARVEVNGRHVGVVWRQGGRCDITAAVRPGTNEIAVTVIGTLRNTFGPYHGDQPLGIGHPGSWSAAPHNGPPPGTAYRVMDYGLLEPFRLLQWTPTSEELHEAAG